MAGTVIDTNLEESTSIRLKEKASGPGNTAPWVDLDGAPMIAQSRQISSKEATASPPAQLPPTNVAGEAAIMNVNPQPSQTMIQSSSSLPTAHTSNSNEMAGPSPYGTRSRNRTGSYRPNYAEDRELDVDCEWSSSKKSHPASTTANQPQAIETEKNSSTGTRRQTANSVASAAVKVGPTGAANSKDFIPGMSTFSVHSESSTNAPPHSRKRKALGSNSHANNASGHVPTHGATRKASHAIPSVVGTRETNMFSFETSQGYLKHGKLKADDGTLFGVNDHVYLVCEPPGEPYYLARIMEFLHADNDHSLPIESLRINWVYRPRDIGRKVTDTRLVFVTMHSDTCPLTSLRGKCRVLHRNDITDLDDYRKIKDNFFFSQMFDRYMRRFYEVIPTSQVINVPERVKKVLDDRWKFVIVEQGRGKELTSAIKTCKRCSGYCASNDSVDCAMCKNTYHMNCVRPPLLKKPARGFAWSCGPCSRRQEKKLEARNTPIVGERALEGEDEEYLDEEEDDHGLNSNPTSGGSPGDPASDGSTRPATAEQLAQAKLWPYRYLGVHCHVEDALDYDDRIYPRASSRLGPRHQANVIVWHGQPLELVKPAEIKRKYIKGSSHKKDAKLSKESIAALEADKVAREKRPKWVVDEPPGFVRRGEDYPNNSPANTAKVCFKLPEVGGASSRGGETSVTRGSDLIPERREELIDDYMIRAKKLAKGLGVKEYSTNFLDKALELLCENNFVAETALQKLQHVSRRKDLKEPELNKEDLKKFEEGVARYGTNLHEVSRHVGKLQKHAEIVRFYYMWKKTDRGKQIWGNFEGRKSRKQAKNLDSTLVDDVADDHDDSAFDNDKAALRKRGFECKFCSTRKSPQWRRAPGTAPGTTVPADSGFKSNKDKSNHLMVALCQRCTGLWRKYAIQWENIDEVAKKVAQSGGRAWKRKMDEELLIELFNANEASSVGMSSTAVAAAASVGIDVPSSLTILPDQESARKKQKMGDMPQQPPVAAPVEPPKKKVIEKPPEPPLIPEDPIIKTLACAVCGQMEPLGEEHFCCRHCRLSVHRNCYGIAEGRSASKWTCDMCSNDATGQLSTSYECALCTVYQNEHELMEPPRTSHKKKTDREREKERLEKELVVAATEKHRRCQEEMGRPVDPREPLKKTSGNNWVHVVCAVFTPCIKFSKAKALEAAEGLGSIPIPNSQQGCKICKSSKGVCVTCHRCPETFHVTCAQQYGYPLGFDVTPVKSSRRDVINTVTLGSETGNLEAVIYCKDHSVKSILHPMSEPVENTGLNALQLFVRNFKQADLSLTGTVRKAAIINSSTRSSPQSLPNGNVHRPSISNGPTTGPTAVPAIRSSRVSPAAVTVKSEEVDEDGDRVVHLSEEVEIEPIAKECTSCGTESSPKWHKTTTLPSPPLSSSPAIIPLSSPSQADGRPRSPHSQTNGHLEGDLGASRDVLPLQIPTHSQDVGHETNGEVRNDVVCADKDERALEQAGVPRQSAVNESEALETLDSSVKYLCHKCYLRKLNEPSPRPVTPLPEAEDILIPDEISISEPRAPSPTVWPLAPVAVPNRQAETWPNQPPPQQNGPSRMPNGIPHSPPAQYTPHVPSHYANPPQYYTNGHEQQRYGLPLQQHQQPNGAPSAYQTTRPASGHMEVGPYPGPPPHHGSPPFGRPTSNGIRSPAVHYRSAHPPLGPPRAAENPFLIPHHHSSPRQHYHGHASPRHRAIDDRPETPTDMNGRNGGWSDGNGQLTNGASASPSLRNLLH